MDTSFWKIKLFKKFQTKNKINTIQEILENCHIFHSNLQHPFQTCKNLNSISKFLDVNIGISHQVGGMWLVRLSPPWLFIPHIPSLSLFIFQYVYFILFPVLINNYVTYRWFLDVGVAARYCIHIFRH